MGANDDLAAQIVALYVDLRQNSDAVFLTYGNLAERLGRPGQQRLLGDPLDRVRQVCEARALPDIATVVVDQISLRDGTVKPSVKALDKYGGWPWLRAKQARVLSFDWHSVDLAKG